MTYRPLIFMLLCTVLTQAALPQHSWAQETIKPNLVPEASSINTSAVKVDGPLSASHNDTQRPQKGATILALKASDDQLAQSVSKARAVKQVEAKAGTIPAEQIDEILHLAEAEMKSLAKSNDNKSGNQSDVDMTQGVSLNDIAPASGLFGKSKDKKGDESEESAAPLGQEQAATDEAKQDNKELSEEKDDARKDGVEDEADKAAAQSNDNQPVNNDTAISEKLDVDVSSKDMINIDLLDDDELMSEYVRAEIADALPKVIPQSYKQIEMSFAPLVKQVAPAVVNIHTKRVVTRRVSPFMNDPIFEQFFGGNMGMGGMSRRQVEGSLGSGVIVEKDGLIVTNAHVVKDAEEIIVVLPDGREYEARKALIDEPSDLALLRIDSEGVDLPFVTLRSSETSEVGDLVLAIGNPFGVGQTVTSGIISAQARASLNISDFNFFIQTDAAINPGNSGGPLLAMDGGVIGINTAIYSRSGGSLGIGFSVPSEMVASIIAAEKSRGGNINAPVIRPWMGITGQKLTKEISESLGLDTTQGVLIADIHIASPAIPAGLQVGDVVLSVNKKTVRDPSEMRYRMATLPMDVHANFETWRAGKILNIKVKAIAPPDKPARQETALSGNNPLSGATVLNINPAVIVEMGLKTSKGVVVKELKSNSYAARFLAPQDLIVGVNGRNVTDVDDLQKILKSSSGANGWNVTIERGGRSHQLVIR
jgi:Do/DeqQ family serine protease